MNRVVNKKAWKGPGVYIGRGRGRCHMLNTPPGQNGWLGNPCAIGRVCPHCGDIHSTGGSTLDCFWELFWRKVETDMDFRKAVLALRGQTLICWCAPNPCHGDVIAKWLRHHPAWSACSECSYGTMDQNNPHWLCTCECGCHH